MTSKKSVIQTLAKHGIVLVFAVVILSSLLTVSSFADTRTGTRESMAPYGATNEYAIYPSTHEPGVDVSRWYGTVYRMIDDGRTAHMNESHSFMPWASSCSLQHLDKAGIDRGNG